MTDLVLISIKQNEKSNLDPLEMAFIRCLCLKNNLFYEMFDVIFTGAEGYLEFND